MSELDLFGNAVAPENKRPMKKVVPVAPPRTIVQADAINYRPYTVEKTGRCSVMLINSDSAHLFR